MSFKRSNPFSQGPAARRAPPTPRPRPVPLRPPSPAVPSGGSVRSGGSLPSGGGLGSGGSVVSAGGLGSGGGAPASPSPGTGPGPVASGGMENSGAKHLYHGLMRMHQHDWEAVREAASQNLGHMPSLMWGSIPTPKFAGRSHHMRSVLRAHSPHIAAKLVEAEHASRGSGGGFGSAIKHLMRWIKNGFHRVASHPDVKKGLDTAKTFAADQAKQAGTQLVNKQARKLIGQDVLKPPLAERSRAEVQAQAGQ